MNFECCSFGGRGGRDTGGIPVWVFFTQAGFESRFGACRSCWEQNGFGRGFLAKLLEATHCLSRNLLLCSFLLLDDCVILPLFICQDCCTTFQLPLSTFLTTRVQLFCPFPVVIFYTDYGQTF